MTMYRRQTGPKVLHRSAPGAATPTYHRFDLAPAGATIGATVHGVDLRDPCDDQLFRELNAALLEWKVLFFREQHLTAEQHASFAGRWGTLVDDQLMPTPKQNPVDNLVVFTRDAQTAGLENEWHSDGTFRPMPTMGTVLRAIEVPPVGGDTLFADMAAAYDNLPPAVQDKIANLTALHDWSIGAYSTKYGDQLDEYRAALPPIEHPVVIAHPVTGRPTLFVNRLFTRKVCGIDAREGDELLDLLCRQADVPEFQCRFHWEPGSIAFWDNVAVQHYGANDYYPARRVMARATFFGPPDLSLKPAG